MAAPGILTHARTGALEPGFEQQLAGLARARGPLRRVVAGLSERLVAGRGWERLGYARLGDYARERLGLSARSLQEFARVGARLAELPQLEAALVTGELPWSKVRLLARFATPEDEVRAIAHARGASVRALERTLRAVDRGALEAGAGPALDALANDEEGGETEPTEHVRIRAPASLCFKWQRAREYAARVAGECVVPGTLLEMVTAEALSALPLPLEATAEPADGASWSEAVDEVRGVSLAAAPRQPHAPEPEATLADAAPPEARGTHTPPATAPAGALDMPSAPPPPLPVFLVPLVEALDVADAFELDARLRRAVRLEQRLDAEVAPLLRRVASASRGGRSLAEYARERLGMSPRKARALVRLERLGDACPALRAAYRSGSLSWVQAQILAPLLLAEAGGDWRRAWLAFAGEVTVRRLEELVDRALLLRETDAVAWRRLRAHPEEIAEPPSGEGPATSEPATSSTTRQTCAQPMVFGAGWRLTVVAPRDVARLFRAVLCTLRRALEADLAERAELGRGRGRLPSEAEAFEAMLDHALESWGASDPWLRRRMRRLGYRVFERDGWRCTVPGCTSRRNLHAHHIVFRSAGGSDALANQTTLCAAHHQRGVHAGFVRIQGRAPAALHYELGVRPGAAPLARYRSGDRVAEPG